MLRPYNLFISFCIQMGNCNRQRIGGVIRFGNFFKLKQCAHHVLHLAFVCATIASYGLFDFVGSVFKRLDARFLQAEHDHATSLSHSKRGLDIALKK